MPCGSCGKSKSVAPKPKQMSKTSSAVRSSSNPWASTPKIRTNLKFSKSR